MGNRKTNSLNQKCVLVQTKISPTANKALDDICEEYGFSSKYEILQYLISSFIKYAGCDSKHYCSKEDILPIELSKIFKDLQSESSRINLVSPNRDKTFVLTESIQLYKKPGRHGSIGAKYTFGKDGELVKTENNSKILKSVLSKLFPQLYKELSSVSCKLGNVSIDDAISYLLKETDNRLFLGNIEGEITEGFNKLSEYETHPIVDNAPKRTRKVKEDG